MVVWVLWHINLCRLFNAKSIFMQIVLFQTIQFNMSTQFQKTYLFIIYSNSSNSVNSVYSYGPPHMAVQKQDDQLELTYSNYVRTQDVTLKTCWRRWMIGRSGERGSRISVLAARHDDDEYRFCLLPEWTWEQWQWRSALHSPKLQHHWNLTIRLFSVIYRTLMGGLPLSRGAVGVFYSPS